MRRDVTTVTLPLLGTAWYERELSRRFDLVPRGEDGEPHVGVTEAALAERARALGRPVAAAITVPARTRNQIGERWVVRGLVYVSDTEATGSQTNHIARSQSVTTVAVDSAATRTWRDRIERWRAGRSAAPSIDPIDEWALGVLACPRLMLSSDPTQARRDSLASTCNLR